MIALRLLVVLMMVCALPAAERPNIVWIVVEDTSAHFCCYGETAIRTPNVDRLAAEGTRFERAYVTAPICSTSRSAIITGMSQTAIGAQHHRSGRGEVKITLPASETVRNVKYLPPNRGVSAFPVDVCSGSSHQQCGSAHGIVRPAATTRRSRSVKTRVSAAVRRMTTRASRMALSIAC